MNGDTSAFIIYQNHTEALFALKHLNGFKVSNDITLQVFLFGKQPPKYKP